MASTETLATTGSAAPGSTQPGAQKGDGELDRENLLSALDAQIKFISDDRRSTGWTRWAIWGALATLTWLAISLFSNPSLSLTRTTLLALGVFAGWSLIESIISLLSSPTAKTTAPARFRMLGDMISAARLQLVLIIARLGLIIFALIWFRFGCVPLLWIYTSFALICNLAICAYAFFPLPFPTRVAALAWIGLALSLIPMVLLIGITIQTTFSLSWEFPGLTADEIRLALILNAASQLLNWLTGDTVTAPLLDHLIQIRQDLAFGRLSLAEANQKTDLALMGLKLADVLHPYVSTTLTKASELKALLIQSQALVTQAENLSVAGGESQDEPDVNAEKIAGLFRTLDQLDLELKQAELKMNDVSTAKEQFVVRSRVIASFSPESRQEVDAITATVVMAIAEAKDEKATFQQRLFSLKAKANELAKPLQNGWNRANQMSLRTK